MRSMCNDLTKTAQAIMYPEMLQNMVFEAPTCLGGNHEAKSINAHGCSETFFEDAPIVFRKFNALCISADLFRVSSEWEQTDGRRANE